MRPAEREVSRRGRSVRFGTAEEDFLILGIVWSAEDFSWNPWMSLDGKIDANLYVQILEDELQQTLVDYGFTPEDIMYLSAG